MCFFFTAPLKKGKATVFTCFFLEKLSVNIGCVVYHLMYVYLKVTLLWMLLGIFVLDMFLK